MARANVCAPHGAMYNVANPIGPERHEYTMSFRNQSVVGGVANVGEMRVAKEQRRLQTNHLSNEKLAEMFVTRPLTENNIKYAAHYILGMVGLTVGFNDDEATTLQMVSITSLMFSTSFR